MMFSLISDYLLAACLGCATISFLVHMAMISAINGRCDINEQFSFLELNFVRTLSTYRHLVPEGNLSGILVFTLGVVGVSGFLGLGLALLLGGHH
jgi:hypothetical protein